MKRYIKSDITGWLADTGERCVMRPNGFWKGGPRGGGRITSYVRVDVDKEYADDGTLVHRQYSMDNHRRFWVETEDEVKI